MERGPTRQLAAQPREPLRQEEATPMKTTIHVASLAVVLGLVSCRDDATVTDRTYEQAEQDPATAPRTTPAPPVTTPPATTPPATAPRPTTPPATQPPSDDDWVDVDRARGAMDQQMDQLRQMGADARDQLAATLERTVKETEERVREVSNELQGRIQGADGAERSRLQTIERTIEESRQDVLRHFSELREATAQQFERARDSFFDAYTKLQSQLTEARRELNDGGDGDGDDSASGNDNGQ